MATLPKLQKQPSPSVISDSTVIDAFADVRGGVIDSFNDTTEKYKGKHLLPFFVKKLQGYSAINRLAGVVTPTKGAAMWTEPDETVSNRFHKLWASGNKIYLTDEEGTIELYDVSDDGYSISRLVGVQAKNNLYLVIGDSTMDSFVYKYIGANTSTATCTDGTGKISISSIEHGLVTGMKVEIAGTTDYDGLLEITVVDANNFTVPGTYTSDQEGTWTVTKQIAKQAMSGMRAASNIMYWENRLSVTGCGANKAIPQYSVLNISGNFTAFTNNAETTGGGDFYGDVGAVNCMISHNGFGILLAAQDITVHKIKTPIPAGTTYIRDPDTSLPEYSVSGNGTLSKFGAISARGSVFYCDPASGVYEMKITQTSTGYSKNNKELTASWRQEFLKYDTSDACVTYDSGEDMLIISGVASVIGGVSDVVLIYSFRTGRWSSDPGKRTRQIIASPEEKVLYGFGSVEPEIQDFFDGSYNDDGEEKELFAWTRMFDGGRRSMYKEHESTTQIIGVHPEVENFKFELVNGASSVLDEVTVDVSGLSTATRVSVPGEWGSYVPGLGDFDVTTSLSFKQYYNDEPVDEFQRVSVRLTEKSSFPCLFFVPEILATLTSDFAEDII